MSKRKRSSDEAAPGELKRVKSSLSTTLEWTIPGFMSWIESQTPGTKQKESPPFSLRCGQTDRKFQLLIQITKDKVDSVGFYLENLSQGNVEVKFKLKAIDKHGADFGPKQISQHKFTQDSPDWGFPNFISLKELKEKADDRLPNGFLTLECHLTISDAEVSIEGYEGPRLKEGLNKLQNDGTATDFSIVCKGQDFPCHKTILAARSEVFKAMFASENVIENTSNEVKINDFEPSTVEDFLHFLYSDELDDPALYTVDLLLIADKYNVVGLRRACEKALVKTFDSSNVLKLLSVVSLIQAPLLIERTANFIFKNLDDLEGTPDWDKLVKTNPEALALIFKHRHA